MLSEIVCLAAATGHVGIWYKSRYSTSTIAATESQPFHFLEQYTYVSKGVIGNGGDMTKKI